MSQLLSYYKSLEKAVEIPSEILNELSSRKGKLDSFDENDRVIPQIIIEFQQIYIMVYSPLINLYGCYLKYHINSQMLDYVSQEIKLDRGYHYRPIDIYHILRQYDIEVYSYVISKISNSICIYDRLCEAIECENEYAFVSTLMDNQCNISDPVNRLCYFLSGADIEKIANEYEELNNEEELEFVDANSVLLNHTQRLENIVGSDPLLSKISELLFLPSIDNHSEKDILLQKKQALLEASKMIYQRLYYLDEFKRPRENHILGKITDRSEVSDLFKEWEAEFENVENIESADTNQIPKQTLDNLIFHFEEVNVNPKHTAEKANRKLAQWSYDHKTEVETFVNLFATKFHYIEAGKIQVKAFARTLTGLKFDAGNVRVKLLDNNAVAAILYISQQKIWDWKMTKVLENFDLSESITLPTSRNWHSGFINHHADPEYVTLVQNTFASFLGSKI